MATTVASVAVLDSLLSATPGLGGHAMSTPLTVEARNSEQGCPSTPNQGKKDNQHGSSYLELQSTLGA